MNRDPVYWLRWLAVLPGALVAGTIAGFPLHWILYATLRNYIDPYPKTPERLLFPFVMALVFVWAGSRIAPEHKLRTSIVLSGIWVLLTIGTASLALSGANLGGLKLYAHGGGIGSIMAIAGTAIGFHIARKEASDSSH